MLQSVYFKYIFFLFRKMGFNREVRPSFEDILRQKQTNHPNMHYCLPAINSEPIMDQNLQRIGVVPHQNLGNRQADLVSNTSKVCISERNIVERSFARNYDQKLSGCKYPISQQLTEAAGVLPTPDLSRHNIWLDVMAVLRREAKPYMLKYPLAPGVTYADHGHDLRFRYISHKTAHTDTDFIHFTHFYRYGFLPIPIFTDTDSYRCRFCLIF